MPNTTNRGKLPYILQSQSQKEVTNASLDLIDALLQAAMVSGGIVTSSAVQKIINKLVRLLEKLALAIKRAGMETEKKQVYACTCFFEEDPFQADLKPKLELIKKSIALLESFDIIRGDST